MARDQEEWRGRVGWKLAAEERAGPERLGQERKGRAAKESRGAGWVGREVVRRVVDRPQWCLTDGSGRE